MDLFEKISKIAATAGGAIAGLLGQWTTLMTFLAIAMVVDYVSGVMVAWAGKSPKSETGYPSSKAGFNGLLKKGFIVLIVLVATMLDKAIGTNGMMFQTATVCYYLANECLSIIENAGLMGLPVPSAIKKAMETLKDKNDNAPESIEHVAKSAIENATHDSASEAKNPTNDKSGTEK